MARQQRCALHLCSPFQRLGDWVAIQSDSGDPAMWGQIDRLLNMTAERIREMGGSVEMADVGTHQVNTGRNISST